MANQPTRYDSEDIVEIILNPSSDVPEELQSGDETLDPANVTKEQVLEKVGELVFHLEQGGQYEKGPTVNGKSVIEWVADVVDDKDKRIQDLEEKLMVIAGDAAHISELTYLD